MNLEFNTIHHHVFLTNYILLQPARLVCSIVHTSLSDNWDRVLRYYRTTAMHDMRHYAINALIGILHGGDLRSVGTVGVLKFRHVCLNLFAGGPSFVLDIFWVDN